MSLLFCFFPVPIPNIRYDMPRWLQLFVTAVSLTCMMILTCSYGVFSYYLYKDFGHFEASRVLAFVYIVLVVTMSSIYIIYKTKAHDIYEEAYRDGLYSRLLSMAKMRYCREENVVIVYLPKEEYDKVIDQYQSSR